MSRVRQAERCMSRDAMSRDAMSRETRCADGEADAPPPTPCPPPITTVGDWVQGGAPCINQRLGRGASCLMAPCDPEPGAGRRPSLAQADQPHASLTTSFGGLAATTVAAVLAIALTAALPPP